MRFVALAGLIALAAAAAWWFGAPPQLPPAAPQVGIVEAAAEPITVHVAGEVVRPGLVGLPAGSRVADAVAAAGGATTKANLTALNLASLVVDEQQIVVPGSSEAEAASGAPGDGRVRINQASASDIEQLPGVGPVLAARIVAHRESFGPFTVVEDLLDVSGIGEAKLATLRDSVVVP